MRKENKYSLNCLATLLALLLVFATSEKVFARDAAPVPGTECGPGVEGSNKPCKFQPTVKGIAIPLQKPYKPGAIEFQPGQFVWENGRAYCGQIINCRKSCVPTTKCGDFGETCKDVGATVASIFGVPVAPPLKKCQEVQFPRDEQVSGGWAQCPQITAGTNVQDAHNLATACCNALADKACEKKEPICLAVRDYYQCCGDCSAKVPTGSKASTLDADLTLLGL